MSRSLLFVFLLSLTLPGSLEAQQAVVSPEFMISEPEWGPAPGRQDSQIVASDGENFLVGWNDQRPSLSLSLVRVARVSRSGEVLDRSGIPLPQTRILHEIIWSGTEYLVFTGGENFGLQVHRVSREGKLLGAAETIVVAGFPSLAWSGRHLVVVQRTLNHPDISAPVVTVDVYSRKLALLKRIGIPRGDQVNAMPPEALSNGEDFLIVWTGYDRPTTATRKWQLYSVRIDGDSLAPGATQVVASDVTSAQDEYSFTPRGGTDGAGYLLAWESGGVHAVALDANGKALSAPTLIASPTRTPSNIVWSGDRYLIGATTDWFSLNSDAVAYMVSSRGEPLGEFAISVEAGEQEQPHAAAAAGRVLFAWTDDRELKGSVRDAAGSAVTHDFPITSGVAIQQQAAAAFDGENAFVVWSEYRDDHRGPRPIRASRVTRGGEFLDGPGTIVARGDGLQLWPAVDFDGEKFLVVWYQQSEYNGSSGARAELRGRWVGRDGTPLGDGSFLIAGDAVALYRAPKVAFDPAGALVVFEKREAGVYRIYAARITKDGVVLDPGGFPVSFARVSSISNAPHSTHQPDVAFANGSYVVVWQEDIPTAPYVNCQITCPAYQFQTDVVAARVSPSGVVLDSVAIPIASKPGDELGPRIERIGEELIVLWTERMGGRSFYPRSVGTVRLDANGRPRDATSARRLIVGTEVGVTFDGREIVISTVDLFDRRVALYRIRAAAESTTISDPVMLPAAMDPLPSVVATAPDEVMVLTSRFFGEELGGTFRYVGRFVYGWRWPDRRRAARR